MGRIFMVGADAPCPCARTTGIASGSTVTRTDAAMRMRLIFMGLLPSWNARHVGQAMRDALVAVDAGSLAGEQEALVRRGRARVLLRQVHRLRAVAIAAFQRVVGLHPLP